MSERATMRRNFILVSIGLGILISACSPKLKLSVFNNTDQLVTISLASESISVPPGTAVTVIYPSFSEEYKIRISSGGCMFTYRLSNKLGDYATLDGFEGVVKVMLDSSNRIHLVSPSNDVIPIGDATLEMYGFPLAPIGESCE